MSSWHKPLVSASRARPRIRTAFSARLFAVRPQTTKGNHERAARKCWAFFSTPGAGGISGRHRHINPGGPPGVRGREFSQGGRAAGISAARPGRNHQCPRSVCRAEIAIRTGGAKNPRTHQRRGLAVFLPRLGQRWTPPPALAWFSILGKNQGLHVPGPLRRLGGRPPASQVPAAADDGPSKLDPSQGTPGGAARGTGSATRQTTCPRG